MYTPSDATLAYLTSWLAKAKHYQTEKKHRRFELTLADFLQLWGDNRLVKLDAWVNAGMRDNRMHNNNQYAYVLGWKNREACATGVMNIHTAAVQSRQKSARTGMLKSGDTHRPDSIEKMRKPKSEKHRKAMSEAAKARWALYRYEKEKK